MRTRALIAIIAIVAPCLVKAEVVYSNLEDGIGIWNWLPGYTIPEVGDLVELSGTSRTLVSVTYWLAEVEPPYVGDIDATLRVYDVNPATQLPGNLLSSASISGFQYDWQNFLVTLDMPTVTLPDRVFVTGEITRGSASRYGVVYAGGPQIGQSNPDVWYSKQYGDWGAHTGAPGAGNLGLAVNAVPEPATCAALALGSLAVLARRKRLA